MTIDGQTDDTIRAILTDTHRIAMVGASDKPWRPSHGVFGLVCTVPISFAALEAQVERLWEWLHQDYVRP